MIVGYFEHISERDVRGWAYDGDAKDLRLTVRIALDELVIGSGQADEFREDLLRLGYGDGRHGFSITYDIPVDVFDVDQIEVVVITPGNEVRRAPLGRLSGSLIAQPTPGETFTPGPPPHSRRPPQLDDQGVPAATKAETVAPPQPTPPPAVPASRSDRPSDAGLPNSGEAQRAAQAERDFDRIARDLVALRLPAPDRPAPRDQQPSAAPQPLVPAAAGLPEISDHPARAFGSLHSHLLAAPDSWSEPKVFVLGAARSGTSAMFSALTNVLAIPGFGESHVIPAFQRVIHQFRLYLELFTTQGEDIMIRRLDRDDLEQVL